MYDAQGNSFDPQAVAIIIWAGLHDWVVGRTPPRHTYPPMRAVTAAFREVREYVGNGGLVGCLRPFPHDLHDRLLDAAGPAHLSGSPPDALPTAAEDGRRS
jgi:hypothetical protein